MEITHHHRFDASPDAVAEMFANEEFAHVRAGATGALDSDVVVDGDSSAEFTVGIRRTMSTSGIPGNFRGMVGPSVAVRYTEAWEAPDEPRDGTFAIEILGVPARAAGSIVIARDGDGSVVTVNGTVTTSIPFLGAVVAKAVAEALENAMQAEFAAGDEWLARV